MTRDRRDPHVRLTDRPMEPPDAGGGQKSDGTEPAVERSDFIRDMIRRDVQSGKYEGVVTRFPPEPNGYLHIGHAKSIVLNFGVAAEFGGRCHLRFDDTNPETEEEEYAESIIRDIRWLGYDWGEHLYYASDYFERFYGFAVELIEKGLAYVDSQNDERIRETRGTVTESGRDSPYRDRPAKESLELLARMREGEFPNGAHVLRAKIDMASPNMKMRDPLLYRIRNRSHYRTGDKWHIYPMYDFAHCLEDAIEGITHSLCTLEFENNREIYDWILENVSIHMPRPYQTEFARLSLTHTVMSKRKLLSLVKSGRVSGWDDPRMPTLAGMRRRGYTPGAIRSFCEEVGVAKANATVEIERLEHAVRDDLNTKAPRAMGVLRPLKVVVESWPEEKTEWFDASYWPHDVPREGTRKVPFTKELYIERDDFAVSPPRGFRRLSPGAEVRLRHACIVECTDVIQDDEGNVVEVRVRHDPSSESGSGGGKRKVKGTIHWVSASMCEEQPVRLYGRLFSHPYPESDPERSFEEFIDESSLECVTAMCEPAIVDLASGGHVQLERLGYFFADPVDAAEGRVVLNRTVPLRDSWAKISARESLQGEDGSKKLRKASRKEAAAPQRAPLSPKASALKSSYGISDEEARVLGTRAELQSFFEEAVAGGTGPRALARWVVNDLSALTKERAVEELPFGPASFARMVRMVDEGKITSRAGKVVLEEMAGGGESPDEIVERLGLAEEAGEELLSETVGALIAEFPDEAARYREGKKALLGFFVGQVMKKVGKGADPRKVRAAVERGLSS